MDSLIDTLLCKGYCKESDIEQARSVQKEYGNKIAHILLNMGIIAERQLVECLSECMKLPQLSDLPQKPEMCILPQVKEEFLLRNNVYPICEQEKAIWLFLRAQGVRTS